MFIKIADIDLSRFTTAHDFIKHNLVSVDQIKQLFEDNKGNHPFPVQIEQFVLDQILRARSNAFHRETFRDESLIDLYTSLLGDLLQWPSLNHQQIVCILTFIQGLLCQIERTDENNGNKLNETFIHACSILMGTKDQKKNVLFNAQQYPKVIDYILQTIMQHQNLYRLMLEEKPQLIDTIEETRTIDFHVFEEPLFPYPLTEAMPLSIYREVILHIPPTPPLNDPSDLNQNSRESLVDATTPVGEPNKELEEMIDSISQQYPNLTREQIRHIFVEVAQDYPVEHRDDNQHILREKEMSLLEKFKSLEIKE